MEEHVLVALTARCVFQVTGAAALDLHTTSGLLLDVLDVGTAMPYYLCSEVEAGDGVYVDRNLLLGPLALRHVNGETNRQSPPVYLPDRIRPARPAPGRGVGTDARRRAGGALVA